MSCPYSAINDRLYIAQNVDESKLPSSLIRFRTQSAISYNAYCDDFGPMNMSCIVDFISDLEATLASSTGTKIAFLVDKGRRNLTNAVFLLGAYMIIKEGLTPDQVASSFDGLDDRLLEPVSRRHLLQPRFRPIPPRLLARLSQGHEARMGKVGQL